jgi:hypothetical protein
MKLARPDNLGYRPNRADSFYGVAAVGAFFMGISYDRRLGT